MNILGVFLLGAMLGAPPDQASDYTGLVATVRAARIVRDEYLYGGDAYICILQNGVASAGKCLDSFSHFSSVEEERAMRDARHEEYFFGFGFTTYAHQGDLRVSRVYPGSPADLAGLEPDDIILEVNGKKGWLVGPVILGDALACSREGEQGNILARRGKSEFAREMQCAKIPNRALWVLRGDGVYFMRLMSFEDPNLNRDLDMATVEFLAGEYFSLVIDLRGNPGGHSSIAVNFLLRFLKDGDLVVSYEKRGHIRTAEDARANFDFDLEHGGTFVGPLYGVPTVILVDEDSASASEMFAGALQNLGYALVVGRRTFGKGVAQHRFELADGSALYLTTREYFVGPSRKKIQEVGVLPNIVIPKKETGRWTGELDTAAEWAVRWTMWNVARACLLDDK